MRQFVLGSLIGLLSLSASADASDRVWYLQIEGGLEADGGGEAGYGISGDYGYALFGTLGTKISRNVNFEAEAGYRMTDFESFAGQGDIDQYTFMINAVYEAPILDMLSISAGLGVGVDHIEIREPLSYYSLQTHGEDTAVASQLKLGLNLAVDDTVAVTVDYRYTRAFTDFYLDEGQGLRNSTLTVGLRFAL